MLLLDDTLQEGKDINLREACPNTRARRPSLMMVRKLANCFRVVITLAGAEPEVRVQRHYSSVHDSNECHLARGSRRFKS
jgi:hypothetical protein